jgi:hypothetical protein
LVSDKFWDDDYVKHGALALVPQVIQQLCRSEKENITTRGIQQSIRDLFLSDARSYAEKKYGGSANPDRVIRGPPMRQSGGRDSGTRMIVRKKRIGKKMIGERIGKKRMGKKRMCKKAMRKKTMCKKKT